MRKAIHQLKFNHDLGLADEFTDKLVETYQNSGWKVDLVFPVPLSSERLKERGYNQAERLAYPFSLSLNLPLIPKGLKKIKHSHSQIGLSAQERFLNVQGAYQLSGNISVQDKTILLVDDVITTGATMNSCAEALISSGAKTVYGIALAKTLIDSQNSDAFSIEILQ